MAGAGLVRGCSASGRFLTLGGECGLSKSVKEIFGYVKRLIRKFDAYILNVCGTCELT